MKTNIYLPALIALAASWPSNEARAHCDGLDGPVVTAAREARALRDHQGDVDAGRAFVGAYVRFLHYVERVPAAARAQDVAHQPDHAHH